MGWLPKTLFVGLIVAEQWKVAVRASMPRAILLLTLLAGVSDPAFGAEFADVEVSLYGVGTWPRSDSIFNQGSVTSASVAESFGAGLKVGIFPNFTRQVVGIEIDSSGHGSGLTFADSPRSGKQGRSHSDLLVFNSMINLIVRYPTDTLVPYVGVGGGWSHGVLLNPNIAGRADQDFESGRSLAYQFLAGAKFRLSPQVFVFGEYRYVAADYHWRALALEFQAHYSVVGVGLRF